jgi:membrane fusion protein (multidrug efflux system)
MKRKSYIRYIIYGLILLVFLILLANRSGLFNRSGGGAAAVSGRAAQVLPVKAWIITPGPLTDKIVAAGVVQADEQVEISAEASGRLTSIAFREGDRVKKGELLATVNNADLSAQMDRINYQIQLAEQRELRQRSLLEKQGISQQTYDQALTELNTLKAEHEVLKAQFDKTMIRAPFDGILGLRQLSEGAYVTPGTKIVRLARLQPVKIEFSIPERYAGYLSRGSSITFTVENSPEVYRAEVYATEAVVDQNTRSLRVRALYSNEDIKILPGSFARVEVSLVSVDDALLVPSEAIIPEMGGSKVFVYRNGKAQPKAVVPGLRTSTHVQINDGLLSGDTIIMSGLLQMRPGMAVLLTEINQP